MTRGEGFEGMRREFLGDDDTFVLLKSQIDRMGEEFCERIYKIPAGTVRPGLYQRTKDGAVFVRELLHSPNA